MSYSFFRKASICVQVDKEIEEPQKQFNIGQVTKQKKKESYLKEGKCGRKRSQKRYKVDHMAKGLVAGRG